MGQISADVSSGPYTANGVQVAFPFTFSIVAASNIMVEVDGEAVSSSLYSVAFGEVSGTVIFNSAPANGALILLVSNPDFIQTSNFNDQSSYNLATVNLINKRATIRDLVLKKGIDRSLKVPVGESGLTIPSSTDRANALLGFDGLGLPIAVPRSEGGGGGAVVSSHEMANASFDMAGNFGNLITVTSTTPLTADRTLGISRWSALAQADNLPLRPANDTITVSRTDTGPHWLTIASVDWSTIDNAWSYVPLWGFHPGLACTITNGSAQVGCTDTTNMVLGTSVAGAGIPAEAVVQSIDNKLQFTMSNPDQTPALATATGSPTLAFGGSTYVETWTGNGWNRNPGQLEVLIAGQTNYSQTDQMRGHPFGAFWSQFNKPLLHAGDSTYNSIVAYPAVFPNKTRIKCCWPNYALGTGVWGYGAVTYGDYDGAPTPPLGFSSVGPKPVQFKNLAYFEATFAFHVEHQSVGADWDLLTEFYLWATNAPTGPGNTPLIEVAFNPYPVHLGSPNFVPADPHYLGIWVDNGVSWYAKGKRGGEVTFSPANLVNDDYLSAGKIDHRKAVAFLISQGLVDGTEWHHGCAFGVEPIKGSVEIQIDRWEPVYGGGKITPMPGTPVAPTSLGLNNLNLDIGYTIPANSDGCVYTVDGGTTYAGWDRTVSANRSRRLRPGTTYNVGVAGYNDGLRGPVGPTLSMTTTVATVDFTSTSIWESRLLNDSTTRNHVTVTPSTYTLPGGGSATGALLQDVSGGAAVACDINWTSALPDLLVGTYGLSAYYNNIGDNRNFSVSLQLTPSRFVGFNVEDNAQAFFGLAATTDGFFGGNFQTATELFQGLTFDGCASNWWRVTGQFQFLAPVPAGAGAYIRLLNRNLVTGNQYESPYIPDGTGQLGFSRFALQAIDFTTSNTTYYGSNLTTGITWSTDHTAASTVTAWDGSNTAKQYLEQAGSGITTGITNSTMVLNTAAHDYIVCFDIQSIGRDFFDLSFDAGDFSRSVDVVFQLSTQQTTVIATGAGDMTCAQSGVVLLAPGHYRLWARVHKPAGMTTLAAALRCSDSSTMAHVGDTAKGFIVQPNTRICQVL